MKTLNEVYSRLSIRRRYEVWFIRLGLADNTGAWWLRYLLMNPGRGGCGEESRALPVQVWATFFEPTGRPQTFIRGFPVESLQLSERGANPFRFAVAENAIQQDSCCGRLHVEGHDISWDLRYKSNFRVTLSDKGWIGFSRSPHSDAVFSGRIECDGRIFEGDPLGFGVQGHNCGYRHRTFWNWTHVFFPRAGITPSTLEALVYDMPLGVVFRKAVLWHDGREYVFRELRETAPESGKFCWEFACGGADARLNVMIDGSVSPVHRLPYLKTDCSGTFDVLNNSLAQAKIMIDRRGTPSETLETATGAVLEMGGQR